MKYFAAVVETNSFTEAAEQMYISQSAISQQIHGLEEDLGVELLLREGRKFTLTPAGEYFYRHSLTLLDEVERLRKETVRIGADHENRLRLGYLKCYGGNELYHAVSDFSEKYPEVILEVVNGTHEELYDLLRFGGVNLVLNDQRRAFSEDYVNFELVKSNCFAELSSHSVLSALDYVTMDELKKLPCILIASKEQRDNERQYYQDTLGFGGSYLFAESLEEGRLMVAGNLGFMPVEGITDDSKPGINITRLPIFREGKQIKRNYCAFWKKSQSGYYVEEFAQMLHEIFMKEQLKEK